MTLLDFPGKIACTVFTAGCNFRCPFCHNASLVTEHFPDPIPTETFFNFLKKRKGLLEGVAVTGGEPLMQPGIEDFLRAVRDLGFAVKLDTNGSFPDRLRGILKAGLADYVAMDIKNSPEKYPLTAGCTPDMDAVRESVSLLLSGKTDFEFRTTVVRELHEEGDFVKIGKWIQGAPHYFLQKFVDSEDLIVPGFTAASDEEMRRFQAAVKPFVPAVSLRGVD